jgi:polyhydroxyalkanoate synthesis regulator protein
MAPTGNPGKIKRYANRLYHTGTARYVSLDDLAGMADDEEDFVVYEANTGEDVRRFVLRQIILQRVNHG